MAAIVGDGDFGSCKLKLVIARRAIFFQDAADQLILHTVIHEMTAISDASDLAHFDRAFAATNWLRTDGHDYLLAAARKCGARRFIAQSFCGWPFARTGGPVKTEEDALDPAPPREFRNSLAAIHHLEGAVAGSIALEDVACVMERLTNRAPG
jgi:hypothetical protein